MTSPNHIAGGIVITGILSSLWNINIFANPFSIIITVFGSLLPDIDHTKSLIGKLFFPISKQIAKKYGHRTITHSLFFLFTVTIFFYLLEYYKIIKSENTYLIVFFAIFSHFALDMITISGIPLFYPFFKNPCVMPGNPNFRLNTNNLQQEGIAFVIFLVLGFSLQPLFSDGFFFSVNKQFNSLKYLNVEFKSNKNLNVKYNFERYNQIFDGSGILIFVDEKKAFINDNKKIIEITEDDKINILKPIKTNKNLFLKNLTIKKISLDSLNYLVQNKFFYEIKLYSNLKFTEKNKMSFSQKFDEKLIYNLEFLQQNDTININQSKENLIKQKENFEQKKLNLKQNIQLKELQLSQELADIKNYNFDYERNKQELKKIQSKLNIEKDMYLINEYKNKIIELNHKISSFIPKNYNSTDRLKTQINQLKNDYNKPFIYLNSDEKINTKIEFEGSLIFVEL